MADPATGSQRRLKRAEFEAKWSGYAALFDYTVDFDSAPEGRSTLAWIRPFFQRHWRALLQAFLLAGIASALQLLFPMFAQVVVDTVLVERDHGLLRTTIVGMVTAGVFAMLASVLGRYLLSRVTVQVDAAMLDYLVRQLLALPMSYFHSRRTGDVLRRLSGARQLREFVVHRGMGAIAAAVVQAVSAVALMAIYSGRLLMVFLCTLPVYLLMMVFSNKVLRPLFGDLEESEGKYSSQQIDAIRASRRSSRRARNRRSGTACWRSSCGWPASGSAAISSCSPTAARCRPSACCPPPPSSWSVPEWSSRDSSPSARSWPSTPCSAWPTRGSPRSST